MNTIKNVTQSQWDTLASKKIYFGHQSVGYNIMDGIEMILKENPNIQLKIENNDNSNAFNHPVFAHAGNGQNKDPKSKINAFCKTMEDGLGNKADIAGFKFCYVDIKEGTDIDEIFKYYKQKMNEISHKYPDVTIIHFTVPLRTLQKGIKGFINSILGRKIGLEDNFARLKFNSLLLLEFKNEDVFDLAKFESTYPDGKREFILQNDEKVYSMVPSYTNDGGHLSEKGKYFIGSKLLLFLAELSNGRQNQKN